MYAGVLPILPTWGYAEADFYCGCMEFGVLFNVLAWGALTLVPFAVLGVIAGRGGAGFRPAAVFSLVGTGGGALLGIGVWTIQGTYGATLLTPPLLVVALAQVVVVGISWRIGLALWRRRYASGRCLRCRYDLAGLLEPGCPECGFGRDSALPAT